MKIEDIPTDTFNRILKDYLEGDWKVISQYDSFDAWIDYGKVVLSKNGNQITFEWDNWSEGWITGSEELLKPIYSRVSCGKY